MMLDTSGPFIFLDARDPDHDKAVLAYANSPRRVTHNYVMAELVPLATSRGLNRRTALEFVRDVIRSPEVDFIWVDPSLHQEGIDLLLRRPDKGYSLCDAVSFVLMTRLGISDALTTDKHFEQEGFTRHLA